MTLRWEWEKELQATQRNPAPQRADGTLAGPAKSSAASAPRPTSPPRSASSPPASPRPAPSANGSVSRLNATKQGFLGFTANKTDPRPASRSPSPRPVANGTPKGGSGIMGFGGSSAARTTSPSATKSEFLGTLSTKGTASSRSNGSTGGVLGGFASGGSPRASSTSPARTPVRA